MSSWVSSVSVCCFPRVFVVRLRYDKRIRIMVSIACVLCAQCAGIFVGNMSYSYTVASVV